MYVYVTIYVMRNLFSTTCFPLQIQGMGRSARRDSSLSLWHALFVSNDSMLISGENGTVHATFPQITGLYIEFAEAAIWQPYFLYT